MANSTNGDTKRNSKYRRAQIRSLLFTVGPDRLSGGRFSRRHLAQDIAVREIEVATPLWPKSFDGLRIGHVSDFHLGQLLPLNRAIEIVNLLKKQAPDFVACTGDVVDLHHDQAQPLMDAMAAVDAPLGTALVLGNHDELHCPDTIEQMGLAAGLHVLRNQAIKLTHNGAPLVVSGIDWARTATQCARFVDQTTSSNGSHILLSHNPRAFARASALNVPITLSGHTHGGQIALKNYPNANLAMTHRHRAGLFTRGGSRLYVTTGIGAWFPLRVNCPPEIVMITMRSQQRKPASTSPTANQTATVCCT